MAEAKCVMKALHCIRSDSEWTRECRCLRGDDIHDLYSIKVMDMMMMQHHNVSKLGRFTPQSTSLPSPPSPSGITGKASILPCFAARGPYLALKHSWTRDGVRLEVIVNLPQLLAHARIPLSGIKPGVTAHVRRIPRVAGLEGTRDLHGRARAGVPPACHVNLRAADVELRDATRVVDGQRLDAQQILAVLDALGDGVLVRVCMVVSLEPPLMRRQAGA